MAVVLRKKGKSATIIQTLCPKCGKYRVIFHYKLTRCNACDITFPIETKSMSKVETRLQYHLGEVNETA